MFLLQRNSQSRLPRATWGWKSKLKVEKKGGGILNLIPAWRHRQQEKLKPPNSAFSPPFSHPRNAASSGVFFGARGRSAEKGALLAPTQPPQKYQRSPTPPAQPNHQKTSQIAFPAQKKEIILKNCMNAEAATGRRERGGIFHFNFYCYYDLFPFSSPFLKASPPRWGSANRCR